MIFKQWQQVLNGTKTQTRRLVKTGDHGLFDGWLPILKVWDKNHRPRWEVDRTYAIQPGRGRKAIGRIRIVEIRRERLQGINCSDCLAEGIVEIPNAWGTPWYKGIGGEWKTARQAFAELWDSINKKPGTRWADDPEVWLLEFDLS